MKGGDGCEEGIEKRGFGKGSHFLVGRQSGACHVDNKEMSQVKKLKGLSPNVAGLQHEEIRQTGPSPICLIS